MHLPDSEQNAVITEWYLWITSNRTGQSKDYITRYPHCQSAPTGLLQILYETEILPLLYAISLSACWCKRFLADSATQEYSYIEYIQYICVVVLEHRVLWKYGGSLCDYVCCEWNHEWTQSTTCGNSWPFDKGPMEVFTDTTRISGWNPDHRYYRKFKFQGLKWISI